MFGQLFSLPLNTIHKRIPKPMNRDGKEIAHRLLLREKIGKEEDDESQRWRTGKERTQIHRWA